MVTDLRPKEVATVDKLRLQNHTGEAPTSDTAVGAILFNNDEQRFM